MEPTTVQDLVEALVLRGCRRVKPGDTTIRQGDWLIWEPEATGEDTPVLQICTTGSFDIAIAYCQHCGLLERLEILDAVNGDCLLTLACWPGWDEALALGAKALALQDAAYDRFLAWQNRSGRHFTTND